MLQVSCIDGSASSNGVVHNNEVILIPLVSRCSTPSSFQTPSTEKNEKLCIIVSLINLAICLVLHPSTNCHLCDFLFPSSTYVCSIFDMILNLIWS